MNLGHLESVPSNPMNLVAESRLKPDLMLKPIMIPMYCPLGLSGGLQPKALYFGPCALIQLHFTWLLCSWNFPDSILTSGSSPCSAHISPSISHNCHFLIILAPISMSPPPGRPPGHYKAAPDTLSSCPICFIALSIS